LRETPDEQAEREQVERAYSEQVLAELDDLVDAVTNCRVPGCVHANAPGVAFCARHAAVASIVETELACDERLDDGTTVRTWMTGYLLQRSE
jgi:hypothetical protein